jgi:outer membrane protein assembly factor BamB
VAGTVIPGLTAAENALYVVIRDRNVIALDAATGMELWRWTMDRSPPPMSRTWFPGAPPYVANGVVHVSTEYHDLVALEAETGREAWRLEVVWEPLTRDEGLPPAAVPIALDMIEGTTRLWRAAIGGLQQSPSLVNDVLLVSTFEEGAYAVIAIDPTTGERRWEVTTDGYAQEMAMTRDALYGGTHWTRVEFPSARFSGGSLFALALPSP